MSLLLLTPALITWCCGTYSLASVLRRTAQSVVFNRIDQSVLKGFCAAEVVLGEPGE